MMQKQTWLNFHAISFGTIKYEYFWQEYRLVFKPRKEVGESWKEEKGRGMGILEEWGEEVNEWFDKRVAPECDRNPVKLYILL